MQLCVISLYGTVHRQCSCSCRGVCWRRNAGTHASSGAHALPCVHWTSKTGRRCAAVADLEASRLDGQRGEKPSLQVVTVCSAQVSCEFNMCGDRSVEIAYLIGRAATCAGHLLKCQRNSAEFAVSTFRAVS